MLEYYWKHSGDIETFWMSIHEYDKIFTGIRVPDDLALYDHQLCISYDEGKELLHFDVVEEEDSLRRLFDSLDQLVRRNKDLLKSVPRQPIA